MFKNSGWCYKSLPSKRLKQKLIDKAIKSAADDIRPTFLWALGAVLSFTIGLSALINVTRKYPG